MQQSFFPMILYGADYNPEQWPESIWFDDMRLMKKAHVNMVSINIFSWALLQPGQGRYEFGQLDRIMNLLAEHGIAVDLATATATPPTWMSLLYPEMLPVARDGKRLYHGSRQHFCPNSLDYRREASELVTRLAKRYCTHPALKLWHINNEYGDHISSCYCDRCAEAFRGWLRIRYQTLDRLNYVWGTNFWSQYYYGWDDILPPRITPASNNPTQLLDYFRFMSESLLACYRIEADILREITPGVPITTNFIVSFKATDYFSWARHLDIISFDNYPAITTPAWEVALRHDLMRSLKGGQPHVVMEQTPSQLNWMPQNPHMRPGRIRLQSMQAIAHGADGVLYFQWRQSKAGSEKFHSAIVPHEGNERGRIFQQVARIGAELEQISYEVAGSRIASQVAILMDWQNWWAVEYQPGPSDQLRYWDEIKSHYHALHRLNVAVDIVSPDDALTRYKLVVAPLLYMLRPGVAENLERFVALGGVLLTTFFSGIVDQNDHVVLGGYPGELRRLLGLYVEEFDPWIEGMTNSVVIREGLLQGSYACSLWGEVVRLEGANVLGYFANDYYAGSPALSVNQFGEGKAYYLATHGNEELLANLARQLCREVNVQSILGVEEGPEVTQRQRTDGSSVFFLLNHGDRSVEVFLPGGNFKSLLTGEEIAGRMEVAAHDVCVLLELGDKNYLKEFEWEDFYKITKDRPPWPLLVEAVDLLDQREDALDLGCGAGRDTRFLLAQGFRVTAVDADPHAVALMAGFSQDHLRVVQSSFESFDFETYTLVNAHFALPFLSEEDFHLVFARIKQALQAGGVFVGQFFGVHDEWNTPENQMTFLTWEQAEAELKGLKTLVFREEDIDSHVADGTPKHWHVFHIIAQKAF